MGFEGAYHGVWLDLDPSFGLVAHFTAFLTAHERERSIGAAEGRWNEGDDHGEMDNKREVRSSQRGSSYEAVKEARVIDFVGDQASC